MEKMMDQRNKIKNVPTKNSVAKITHHRSSLNRPIQAQALHEGALLFLVCVIVLCWYVCVIQKRPGLSKRERERGTSVSHFIEKHSVLAEAQPQFPVDFSRLFPQCHFQCCTFAIQNTLPRRRWIFHKTSEQTTRPKMSYWKRGFASTRIAECFVRVPQVKCTLYVNIGLPDRCSIWKHDSVKNETEQEKPCGHAASAQTDKSPLSFSLLSYVSSLHSFPLCPFLHLIVTWQFSQALSERNYSSAFVSMFFVNDLVVVDIDFVKRSAWVLTKTSFVSPRNVGSRPQKHALKGELFLHCFCEDVL